MRRARESPSPAASATRAEDGSAIPSPWMPLEPGLPEPTLRVRLGRAVIEFPDETEERSAAPRPPRIVIDVDEVVR